MSPNITTALLLFLTAIIALSMIKTAAVPGRTLSLFRALFPSWRFFEDTTEVPVLFYRVAASNEKFGQWRPGLKKPNRHWYSIFLNPEGNLFLAYVGLLEQLLHDAAEIPPEQAERLADSVSYQLTKNLVLQQILETHRSENLRFQFKICSLLQGASEDKLEDALISATHQA